MRFDLIYFDLIKSRQQPANQPVECIATDFCATTSTNSTEKKYFERIHSRKLNIEQKQKTKIKLKIDLPFWLIWQFVFWRQTVVQIKYWKTGVHRDIDKPSERKQNSTTKFDNYSMWLPCLNKWFFLQPLQTWTMFYELPIEL